MTTELSNAVAEIYLNLAEYSYNSLRCAFQQSADDTTAELFDQQLDRQLKQMPRLLQLKNSINRKQLAKILDSVNSLKKEVDVIKEFVRSEHFDNNISRISAIAPALSHGQLLSLDVDDYLRELKLSEDRIQQATDNRVALILELSVAILLLSSLAVCCISLFFESTVAQRLKTIKNNQLLLKELKEPQFSTADAKDELDYVNKVLSESALQLIQLMNETKQLIYMIAHDLRSPLMSVQVLIVMFSEKYEDILSESELLTCDRLESLLANISEVVTDLLLFDSLKSGHCKPRISTNDLHEMTQQAISKNRTIADAKRIRLENRCAGATLNSDKELTARALSLCLKRAIQRVQEESTITVSSGADAKSTSCKIAEENPNDHTASSGASPVQSESTKDALYLSLSQLVAQAHGGRTEFTSAPKLTYQFFFPKNQASKHTIAQTSASPKASNFWLEIGDALTTSLGRASLTMTVIPLSMQLIGFLLMGYQVYAAQQLEREAHYHSTIVSILNTTWTKTYEGNSALAFYILDDDVEDKREAITKYEALSELLKSAADTLNKSDSNYKLCLETQAFIDKEVALFRDYLAIPKLSSRTDALGTIPQVVERAEQVHLKLETLFANESRLLSEKQQNLSAEWRLLQNSLIMLTVCNFIVLVALALGYKKRTWEKLNCVVQTAQMLGMQQTPLKKPLEHADELGELDRALHTISTELEKTRAENGSITSMLKEEIEGPLQRGLEELQELAQLEKTKSKLLHSPEKNDLDQAVIGTQRLIRLVNELFSLAGGGNPRLVIINRVHRLDTFLNEIGQTMNILAAKKHIQLEVSAPAETANFDRGRIGQVLINLINNAIKFSPRNSKIKLDCSVDGVLTFKVIDEGPGIHDADLLKVFDKHYKSEQSTGAAFGLGLTLCKSIIEASSGTISVQNNVTGGATFTVEIPQDTHSLVIPTG